MKLCGNCKNRGKKSRCDLYTEVSNYAEKCKDFEEKKPTNADRIRSMSDEELVEFFLEKMDCAACPASEDVACEHDRCLEYIKEWLQSEVEETR